MLITEDVEIIKRIVSTNLKKLRDAMGWTQARFAEKSDVSEAALSNYLKGERLPSIDFLIGLCRDREIIDKGYELTVDLLLSEDFNPVTAAKNGPARPAAVNDISNAEHRDVIGSYFCYYYDQSKQAYDQDVKSDRALRYGVIAVYDYCETVTGKMSNKVNAVFFKEEEKTKARALKARLDDIFAGEPDIIRRNAGIESAFDGLSNDNSPYKGSITFTENHMYFAMQGLAYGDNALMALYSPQKRAKTTYIGGLGTIASVSRGIHHMPSAQKIIISKRILDGCSDDIIKSHLSMSHYNVCAINEAEALGEFCAKLFSDNDRFAGIFDGADKIILIRRRMDQLIKNYIEKNICAVGSVSEDDDQAVFRLIQSRMDN